MNDLPFEQTVGHLPSGIKAYAQLVKDCLKDHPLWMEEADVIEDNPEMKANLTLTYRHLEDAAMRLGKVLERRRINLR